MYFISFILGAQEKDHRISITLKQFHHAIFFTTIEISYYISITMSELHRSGLASTELNGKIPINLNGSKNDLQMFLLLNCSQAVPSSC